MEQQAAFFITLEGLEGVGKSSSLEFIQKFLNQKNIPFEVTREPGGTPLAESIRRVLLSHYDEKICPETELLLLFAARAQHITSEIKPALESGRWVLCDRFTDASYAYQGGGRQIPQESIAFLENFVQKSFQPHLTLLFDAPVKVALARTRSRGSLDRFEVEQEDFFERVRAVYLQRAKQFPKRYQIIDASQTVEKVQQQLTDVLHQFIQNSCYA